MKRRWVLFIYTILFVTIASLTIYVKTGKAAERNDSPASPHPADPGGGGGGHP